MSDRALKKLSDNLIPFFRLVTVQTGFAITFDDNHTGTTC
jgi:hypothetical protein